MSLTKAAEALNKILNNEKSTGSALSRSNNSLPPILLPAEKIKEYAPGLQNQENENLENLSRHLRIRVDCRKYSGDKISETSFEEVTESAINRCTSTNFNTTDASISINPGMVFQKEAADLNVLTVSRNSSVFPFIEQIFNVERGSMSVGSLTDLEFEEFTPLDPSKYKTELCRSYQVHGYCKYGIRCNYAHGLTQIRVAYRHGKYKTRNCQSYHETGFCRYGARCSFIHDAEEGILKCPITDREVLEALHYRPMSEFHHIATITWRMVEHDSYPPTEVHFFTPSIGNKITEISDSLLCPYLSFDEKSLLEESLFRTLKGRCRGINKERQISSALSENDSDDSSNNANKNFNSQTSLSSESTFENMENSDESVENSQSIVSSSVQCYENSSGLENNSSKLIESKTEKIPITKDKCDSKEEGTYNARLIKPSSYQPCKKNSCDNSKPEWTQSVDNFEKFSSNYSVSFKNFNLEDFFNCLKTREGQQHLASWASEGERRNSNTTSESSSSQRSTIDFSCKRQTIRSGRDLSKYKTELCRSYQYNKYCEYNESCLYAHGTEDLRSYPKHPLYRTKKCFSFHKKGFCLYGSRCQFLHDVEIPLLQ